MHNYVRYNVHFYSHATRNLISREYNCTLCCGGCCAAFNRSKGEYIFVEAVPKMILRIKGQKLRTFLFRHKIMRIRVSVNRALQILRLESGWNFRTSGPNPSAPSDEPDPFWTNWPKLFQPRGPFTTAKANPHRTWNGISRELIWRNGNKFTQLRMIDECQFRSSMGTPQGKRQAHLQWGEGG